VSKSVSSVNDALVLDIPGTLIPSPNGSEWLRVLMQVSDAETLLNDLSDVFGAGE